MYWCSCWRALERPAAAAGTELGRLLKRLRELLSTWHEPWTHNSTSFLCQQSLGNIFSLSSLFWVIQEQLYGHATRAWIHFITCLLGPPSVYSTPATKHMNQMVLWDCLPSCLVGLFHHAMVHSIMAVSHATRPTLPLFPPWFLFNYHLKDRLLFWTVAPPLEAFHDHPKIAQLVWQLMCIGPEMSTILPHRPLSFRPLFLYEVLRLIWPSVLCFRTDWWTLCKYGALFALLCILTNKCLFLHPVNTQAQTASYGLCWNLENSSAIEYFCLNDWSAWLGSLGL